MKIFKKILGGALVASPFIGMFVLCAILDGLTTAVIVFGSVFAIVTAVLLGFFLLINN